MRFYNELYGSEYEEDEELSAGFYAGLSKFQEKSKAVLERPLCEGELWNALQNMESGKAPGIDGLPVEFYLGGVG